MYSCIHSVVFFLITKCQNYTFLAEKLLELTDVSKIHRFLMIGGIVYGNKKYFTKNMVTFVVGLFATVKRQHTAEHTEREDGTVPILTVYSSSFTVIILISVFIIETVCFTICILFGKVFTGIIKALLLIA